MDQGKNIKLVVVENKNLEEKEGDLMVELDQMKIEIQSYVTPLNEVRDSL